MDGGKRYLDAGRWKRQHASEGQAGSLRLDFSENYGGQTCADGFLN